MKVLYFSLIAIVLDQITKLLVKGFSLPYLKLKAAGINYHRGVEVIDGFLMLTKAENYGIAFGLDFGKNFRLFLMVFTITAVLGLLYYLYLNRKRDFYFRLSLALIFGGAFGNLIDRIFYGVLYGYGKLFQGRVVDFIQIKIFEVSLFGRIIDSLPIFNFADIFISAGLIMLFVSFWKENSNYNSDNIKPETTTDQQNN